MNGKWLGGLLFSMLCLTQIAHADTIVVVTEDNYPLSYEENGQVVGQATELVKETLDGAGLAYTIGMYPWARAYGMARTEPYVLIYSMARTPEREEQFKWVGAVAPRIYVLYKLRSREDIAITTLEEAKAYRIGVVKDDVRHKYLVAEGVSVEEVTNDTQNMMKLRSGRIDLFPISPKKLEGLCETENVDCASFAPAMELDFRPDLYMAFSNATPDDIVERARAAYETLKQEGALTRLLPTYWAP